MSIFRKSTIENLIGELDQHYEKLKTVMRGTGGIDSRDARAYGIGESSEKEMTNVNIEDVLDAVAHFKTAVDNIRRIKARAYRP